MQQRAVANGLDRADQLIGRDRIRVVIDRRPFGGVVWIVLLAVLLAGVVAVNVAVLQLNVRLDELGRERVELQGETKRLSSQLSSASATARIESQAKSKLGLVQADPELTYHVQLPPPGQ